MHDKTLIENLTDLAESFGYEVRLERLDFPGGACILGGKRMLFVDASASAEERIETFAVALAREDLESVYILPEVRETIERFSRPLD